MGPATDHIRCLNNFYVHKHTQQHVQVNKKPNLNRTIKANYFEIEGNDATTRAYKQEKQSQTCPMQTSKKCTFGEITYTTTTLKVEFKNPEIRIRLDFVQGNV